MVQDELGADAIVTTVLCDDNQKYLSTDLLREEPVRDGHLSPEVELVDYQAIKRVCFTCCDMHECPQIHEIKKSLGMS
jgi:cysteine synthase A